MYSNFGILLIALDGWGSGFYYHLSYNMAISIKLNNPGIQIALLTDDVDLKHLSYKQKSVFDKVIHVSMDDYLENYLINPFKLKTKIYDYSPFETTLYLDSDGLYCKENKTILDLIGNLGTFQIHEVRRYTKANANESGMIWTKLTENTPNHFVELWDKYGLSETDIYPEYNSSFIFFTKNEANKKYFDLVQKNYFDRRVEWKALGTSYPDEMAFNISSAQLQHLSTIESYKPCYIEWEHTEKELEYIRNTSWFMMMAGGHQITKMVTFYDNLTKLYRHKYGDGSPFRFEMNKKIFFRK